MRAAPDRARRPPGAGTRPLILGVGHRWRRDDGVGPAVADALAASGRPARAHESDGAALLALLEGLPGAVLIDAMQAGGPPGEVRRFDASAAPLPARFRRSSHLFGLAEAVETGRALGALPARLEVIGIEGADFGLGEGLSPAVAAAAARLVADLLAAD